MLSKSTLNLASNLSRSGFQRNLATSYVALNKAATDPIQQIFVDSIKLYAQKKTAAGGKFVDGTKETEAALQADLDRVAKKFGGGEGVDMTKFPDFKWADPAVDAIDIPKIEATSDRVVIKEKKSLKLLAQWYDLNTFVSISPGH